MKAVIIWSIEVEHLRVALDGLKFVVPGWCPGPDDGSLAETNSNATVKM